MNSSAEPRFVVCHLAMLEISDDDEWPEPVSDEEYITANQQQ